MRALVMALLSAPAMALPPVTQEEAVAFHTSGLCAMASPGQGITRPDGKGWIVSSIPGPHVIRTGRMSLVLDMTPGIGYRLDAPGGAVEWCPRFVPSGRDACGPVPSAFLYDAKTYLNPTGALP